MAFFAAVGAGVEKIGRCRFEIQVETLIGVGGEKADGERLIWWNFVASSREILEEAKVRWRERRFERVPGDDEFIPLPQA